MGDWMISVQSAAILRLLAARDVHHVLDVGGGHAQVAPTLLRSGYRVTSLVSGPDAAGQLVELAGAAPKFTLETGDLMRMPFPPRRFDAVVSMRTLTHVRDWRGFLVELCRLSADTVVIDFARGGLRGRIGQRLFSAKRLVERDTRPFRVIELNEINRILEEEGFEVSEVIGQFVLPMAVHRVLRAARISAGLERSLSRLAGRLGNPIILSAVRRPARP